MKKIILGLVLFVNVVAFADGPTQVVEFPEELSLVLVHPDFAAAVDEAKSKLTRKEELVMKSASVTEMNVTTTYVHISVTKRTHQLRQGGNRITEEFHLGAITGQLVWVRDANRRVREISVFFTPAADLPGDK